jgi:predicted homoserine dehydrogenase-like protein
MGMGEFGASFLFQARDMPCQQVSAICTRTVQRAVEAYLRVGIPESKVSVCATAAEAAKAHAERLFIVVDSFDKLAGVPLEVLVESSGAPENSAAAAESAIARGMHVIMISKETDSIVGPILGFKAKEKGVVYSTGDGDQPSMLIGLISWGRALGLPIVGAGKASEYDFICDPVAERVHCAGQKKEFACPGIGAQWLLGNRPAKEVVDARAALMNEYLTMRSVPDLCEMTVVANATGMKPDRPDFHAPVARMPEMPDLFCPKADGGLFDESGSLDIFNCLRRRDEVSMAGGEFIIVECKDRKSWNVLANKGHPVSRNEKFAAIYLPQHLLGVESGTSVLFAAIMGHATGGDNLRPVCDLHGRAAKDMKKGCILQMGGHHHVIDGVEAFIGDATAVAGNAPLPFYLFSNLALARNVPAGKPITLDDVVMPENSTLMRLRLEQDQAFNLV